MNSLSRFYDGRRRHIDSMYGAFNNLMKEFTNVSSTAMDIKETEDEYVATIEAPGMNKEDIKLDVEDGVLYLRATQESEIEEEEGNYIRRGRSHRSFTESFSLKNVKEDEITASYVDGLLTVTMPKIDKGDSKTKSIEIK